MTAADVIIVGGGAVMAELIATGATTTPIARYGASRFAKPTS